MQKPAVLVMTATITPFKGMPGVSRADPEIRLRDYIQALKFYLSLPHRFIDRILFLENSGADFDRLRQAANAVKHDKTVEFIACAAQYRPEIGVYGKGYGEFSMINEGLANCRALSPSDTVWKITGRLSVLNMVRLLQTAPKEYGVYCDLRDVPLIGDRLGGNAWMDLRLFSCRVDAYDAYFRNQMEAIAHESPEKVFFSILKTALKQDLAIIPRFRIQPMITGYGAFNNVDYQDRAYKTKENLRTFTRLFAPWLWL